MDLVLTDPPYFLDKMDNNWNHHTVSMLTEHCHTIKSLPPGMKFDKEQGRRFYDWYLQISKELHRLLKPGGFFFSFSSKEYVEIANRRLARATTEAAQYIAKKRE